MTENIKKTKGFIQTPSVIVDIMHNWLGLTPSQKLLDLTAGQGALFKDHPKEKCFGCELDKTNYLYLKEKGYTNILEGDVFDVCEDILFGNNLIENDSIDAVILNPPYGALPNKKNSVDIMNLALNKLKPSGRFAIINQSNFYEKYKDSFDFFQKNTTVELAALFDTNLFQPFANVKTMLILGTKESPIEKECTIWNFDNNQIKVNKRAKFVTVELLKPKEETTTSINLWEDLKSNKHIDTRPTLADFNKTIIEYMSFESGLPKEFFYKPEKLGKALNYIYNKAIDKNN